MNCDWLQFRVRLMSSYSLKPGWMKQLKMLNTSTIVMLYIDVTERQWQVNGEMEVVCLWPLMKGTTERIILPDSEQLEYVCVRFCGVYTEIFAVCWCCEENSLRWLYAVILTSPALNGSKPMTVIFFADEHNDVVCDTMLEFTKPCRWC